ncbi:MAG: phosphoadenosine phosphosulfate reductase family protein [Erysipelotrichaceae bacterium]|nr:phosphoadenosine phosphosulfate reductase family protein [Erysipelotrichaceae bacterium]
MIRYICRHCDGLICETSKCPVCGNRTDILKTSIFYCDECNAPSFDENCPVHKSKNKLIGTDLRPVFAEERLLLEILLKKPMIYAGKSIWSTASNTYWIDGKKLKLNLAELSKTNPIDVIKDINKYQKENRKYVDLDFDNEHINTFIRINSYRLNTITEEAIEYIRGITQHYDLSSIFVSFSGGKDSTVTSNLVIRAMDTEKIVHIYGDTTLEYPESAKYIVEFRKRFPEVPLLVAKNNAQTFSDLCTIVGPPSRVLRWCCTVFKTGAITKKIEQVFDDKKNILSFQGIRRSESASRSKYDRSSNNSKITKQTTASPIIDWLDFDVWLYILSNKLPFNNAYRQGFSRVGCWCCPNNSNWSEFLSSIYMHDEYTKFHDLLYEFAKRVGKEDWQEYIDSGNWKARQGGNGLKYSENAVVNFKPCALESNAYNYDLTRPITENLYTLFKPFGILNYDMGNKRLNEVYVLDKQTNNPILKLSGRLGTTSLRINILSNTGMFKYPKTAEQALKNQITKYQTCIACGYCQAVCRFNALKVTNVKPGSVSNESVRYTIDSDLCAGCLECVKHFDSGCYMKKVLRVKKG